MKRETSVRLTPAKLQRMLDETLAAMIDEWFENVSVYYSTDARQGEPELKRFHDEKGHRIKFSKDALQCTYGLRVIKEESSNRIEISVNNKVEAFDYEEFLSRLDQHFQASRKHPAGGAQPVHEIFELESDFRQAFKVERSDGKADVVRLSFLINADKIGSLTDEPRSLRTSIEEYCLSPLRRIYAELYRRSSRR